MLLLQMYRQLVGVGESPISVFMSIGEGVKNIELGEFKYLLYHPGSKIKFTI